MVVGLVVLALAFLARAVAFQGDQGVGQGLGRLAVGRLAGCLTGGLAVALQGLVHRLGVEQCQGRPAVRAGVVVAYVHRAPAAGAGDAAHAPRQGLDLERGEVAHKALFDHEGAKGGEAPVPCRAAVGDVAPALGQVVALDQVFAAMRAAQPVGQGVVRVAMVFMQQREELQHGGRRQARVLLRVEPQALAGKAQIQLQHAAVGGGKAALVGRLAAGGAK